MLISTKLLFNFLQSQQWHIPLYALMRWFYQARRARNVKRFANIHIHRHKPRFLLPRRRTLSAIGCCPTLLRCPFGEYDDHVICAVRAMGMEPVQWSIELSQHL